MALLSNTIKTADFVAQLQAAKISHRHTEHYPPSTGWDLFNFKYTLLSGTVQMELYAADFSIVYELHWQHPEFKPSQIIFFGQDNKRYVFDPRYLSVRGPNNKVLSKDDVIALIERHAPALQVPSGMSLGQDVYEEIDCNTAGASLIIPRSSKKDIRIVGELLGTAREEPERWSPSEVREFKLYKTGKGTFIGATNYIDSRKDSICNEVYVYKTLSEAAFAFGLGEAALRVYAEAGIAHASPKSIEDWEAGQRRAAAKADSSAEFAP